MTNFPVGPTLLLSLALASPALAAEEPETHKGAAVTVLKALLSSQ